MTGPALVCTRNTYTPAGNVPTDRVVNVPGSLTC